MAADPSIGQHLKQAGPVSKITAEEKYLEQSWQECTERGIKLPMHYRYEPNARGKVIKQITNFLRQEDEEKNEDVELFEEGVDDRAHNITADEGEEEEEEEEEEKTPSGATAYPEAGPEKQTEETKLGRAVQVVLGLNEEVKNLDHARSLLKKHPTDRDAIQDYEQKLARVQTQEVEEGEDESEWEKYVSTDDEDAPTFATYLKNMAADPSIGQHLKQAGPVSKITAEEKYLEQSWQECTERGIKLPMHYRYEPNARGKIIKQITNFLRQEDEEKNEDVELFEEGVDDRAHNITADEGEEEEEEEEERVISVSLADDLQLDQEVQPAIQPLCQNDRGTDLIEETPSGATAYPEAGPEKQTEETKLGRAVQVVLGLNEEVKNLDHARSLLKKHPTDRDAIQDYEQKLARVQTQVLSKNADLKKRASFSGRRDIF
ncbi:cilia- and flagella-associated protein 251-like [Nematostella vectensis]|uniref:cilia- and flagella-associated protein 251-like n=1 Tax=Nematostella vectensis TaxID=45351 RepID=UPI002077871F|nr:cilia- and flagella-associated protein 251-like [Nematostella vectensis]